MHLAKHSNLGLTFIITEYIAARYIIENQYDSPKSLVGKFEPN